MTQAALLTPATEAELALLGVAVGTVGALAGVGGGFLVVPVLLLAFHLPPAVAAGTSLVMVAANALAGSLLHGRRGLLDWRGGLFLTATAYPGTLLGAHFGSRLRSEHFTLAFGLLLVAMAAVMAAQHAGLLRRRPAALAAEGGPAGAGDAGDPTAPGEASHGGQESPPGTPPAAAAAGAGGEGRRWCLCQALVERGGPVYAYCFALPIGGILSLGVGAVGATLGIGGGPLLVPGMIYLLHYPAHVAAATSQFVILLTSGGAAVVYALAGKVTASYAASLAAGTLAGAPLGAWLARRLSARQLVLVLAGLLFLTGLRLTLQSLGT